MCSFQPSRVSRRFLLILVGVAGLAAGSERLQRRPGFECPVQFQDGNWVQGGSHLDDVRTDDGVRLRYSTRGSRGGFDWSGTYLNFNHRREDPAVSLSRESGPGTVWRIVEEPHVKNRSGFGYKIYTRISPATGPMKDWVLTQVDGQLMLTKDGPPARIYAYIDDLNDGK